jgi:hypothetical protein
MARKNKKQVNKEQSPRTLKKEEDVIISTEKEAEDDQEAAEVTKTTDGGGMVADADTVGILTIPLDALATMITYLPAKSLAALSATCHTFYNYLRGTSCGTKAHFFSRLHNDNVQLVSSQVLLDQLLEQTLNPLLPNSDDNTWNTINDNSSSTSKVKKKKKTNDNDKINNSYPTYARFLEEVITGIHEDLPPYAKLNGKIASVSPEHTLCRTGGGGRVGGGASGCAAFGVGKRGQLGNGSRTPYESSPYILRGGIGYSTVRIVQVSAGGGLVHVAHSLLLTDDGRVLSFGTGHYGQLGHGWQSGKQLPDETRPRFIDALLNQRIVCISAGELHSAAISDDGNLYTWGDSFCGQCGHGDKRPQLLPTKVSHKNIKHESCMVVSCGNRHTLVVTEDGDVFSFGLGHFGVLGRAFTPFDYHLGAAAAAVVDPTVQQPFEVPPNDDLVLHGGGEFQLTAAQMSHLDLLANCTLDDSSDQCIPVIIDSLSGIKIVGASAGHRHRFVRVISNSMLLCLYHISVCHSFFFFSNCSHCSLVLDENGVLYSFGAFLGGALGHGNLEKQEYPVSIQYFGKIRCAGYLFVLSPP